MNTNQPRQLLAPQLCPQCKAKTIKGRPFCPRCKMDLYHGQVKKPKHGLCIYCENHRKLSEEHIFPRWLRNHYPYRHKKSAHYLSRPDRHAFWEPVPMHGQKYELQGDPYTTTLRNVCATCNNGWMSALQNQAKPLVKQMADGFYPELKEPDFRVLARWCTMVSINFEHYARILVTSQHQRTILMNEEMPPGWKVSIGILETDQMAGESFNRVVQIPMEVGESDFIKLESTYFCIERAAFHTLSSLTDGILNLAILGTGLSSMPNPLSPIWPNIREINSHASTILTRADLIGIQRNWGSIPIAL